MKKLFVLLFFINAALASQYPIITSIQSTYVSSGANYDVTEKLIDIGPSVDEIPPSGGYIIFGHRHADNSPSKNDTFVSNGYLQTNGRQSLSELGIALYKQLGSPTHARVVHEGPNIPFMECVAYAYSTISMVSQVPWAYIKTPGGCLTVPPADQWCKITTPELLLDHGTISLKEAEGSSASAQMGVQCTTQMAVTFNIISNDKYIYLDDGKSEISVNDVPLNTKVDLPEGDSSLHVKDYLTGVTKEGYHTGSSVLVMMPY
ncbi:hypothetical protein ACM915_001795 [Cronobacter turicensis]